jgi:hypothetical protein
MKYSENFCAFEEVVQQYYPESTLWVTGETVCIAQNQTIVFNFGVGIENLSLEAMSVILQLHSALKRAEAKIVSLKRKK